MRGRVSRLEQTVRRVPRVVASGVDKGDKERSLLRGFLRTPEGVAEGIRTLQGKGE
ncbi:hypothetical protein [Nostoc sp. 106C]|uniref:hypothetical protein n=1 Tax=Nostoc sp. 106C TaxID=1932667 RepID=UPI0014122653|nr:hypothetical protein [Nostoc sp. 106C]